MEKKYKSFNEKKKILLNEKEDDNIIYEEIINDGPYEEELIKEYPYLLKEKNDKKSGQ